MIHAFGRIFVCALLAMALASIGGVRMAEAHPHVYVDGGVSFVMDDEGALTALEVTWRYDLFETLYALSSLKIVPQPDGTLSDIDRQRVSDFMVAWPEAFKGSAHLTVAGERLPLIRPTSMDVRLDDGNLLMRFRRDLDRAVQVRDFRTEVAFYESTYFYAFSVTEEPEVYGAGGDTCTARVIQHNADPQLESLQVTLFALGREETPDVPNVGELFADRIVLKCE